ncbi:hypothetical protein KJ909_04015 [Patescibacteria group bacterium]|nr:hypothetical protein [Patescibacteria group bacterium]
MSYDEGTNALDPNKPFPGAEAGKTLFWLDGINRWVLIEPHGTAGQRLAISFLVNTDRHEADKFILPDDTRLALTSAYLSPAHLQRSGHPLLGRYVVEYVWMVFQGVDETWEETCRRFREDNSFLPPSS